MSAWTQLSKSGPTLFLLIALLVPQAVVSAPFEHDTTEIEYYPVADSTGCYYNFQHYDEGDRIITNEPCLNCTCHNRMLMCYLRVCPFTKAIGQDCKVEKRADQCCPVITCPEVPVHLLPSTTQSSTAVGHLDAYGCSIDGLFYSDGARVPSEPNKPCELCYCIRNKTACVMQQCTLEVEGCKPVYQEGVCCPVRYNCEHPEYPLLETTTRRLITTTALPTTTLAGPVDCIYENEVYADGALIRSDKRCERCYCMKGDIVCAVQKCNPTPLDKVNCTALPPKEDQCCPDSYECDHIIEEELTTIGYLYTSPSTGLDDSTTLSPQIDSKHEEAVTATVPPSEEENEITYQGPKASTALPARKEDEGVTEFTDTDKERPEEYPHVPGKEGEAIPETTQYDKESHATEPTVAKTELPDHEINEIPVDETATIEPYVPAHDEIAQTEDHEEPEVGSGETEEQHPHVTESTHRPELEVTEKSYEQEQYPEQGHYPEQEQYPEQVPEQPTEVPEESTTPKEGEEPAELPHGVTEKPQHTPTEASTDLPKEHITTPQPEIEHATEQKLLETPETEPKGTETPKPSDENEVGQETAKPTGEVTTEREHGTEYPSVQHVTETAPEIGTGLPHEMEVVPEAGKTPVPPEQTTEELLKETQQPDIRVTEEPSHTTESHISPEEPIVSHETTEKSRDVTETSPVLPEEEVTEPEISKKHPTEIPATEGTQTVEDHTTQSSLKDLETEPQKEGEQGTEASPTEKEKPEQPSTELPQELPKEHEVESTKLPVEAITESAESGKTTLPPQPTHEEQAPVTTELPKYSEGETPASSATVIPIEQETEAPKQPVSQGEQTTEQIEEHVTVAGEKSEAEVTETPELPQEQPKATIAPESQVTEHLTTTAGVQTTQQPHVTDETELGVTSEAASPTTQRSTETTQHSEELLKVEELPEQPSEQITEHPHISEETEQGKTTETVSQTQQTPTETTQHSEEQQPEKPSYIDEGKLGEEITEQPHISDETEQGATTESVSQTTQRSTETTQHSEELPSGEQHPEKPTDVEEGKPSEYSTEQPHISDETEQGETTEPVSHITETSKPAEELPSLEQQTEKPTSIDEGKLGEESTGHPHVSDKTEQGATTEAVSPTTQRSTDTTQHSEELPSGEQLPEKPSHIDESKLGEEGTEQPHVSDETEQGETTEEVAHITETSKPAEELPSLEQHTEVPSSIDEGKLGEESTEHPHVSDETEQGKTTEPVSPTTQRSIETTQRSEELPSGEQQPEKPSEHGTEQPHVSDETEQGEITEVVSQTTETSRQTTQHPEEHPSVEQQTEVPSHIGEGKLGEEITEHPHVSDETEQGETTEGVSPTTQRSTETTQHSEELPEGEQQPEKPSDVGEGKPSEHSTENEIEQGETTEGVSQTTETTHHAEELPSVEQQTEVPSHIGEGKLGEEITEHPHVSDETEQGETTEGVSPTTQRSTETTQHSEQLPSGEQQPEKPSDVGEGKPSEHSTENEIEQGETTEGVSQTTETTHHAEELPSVEQLPEEPSHIGEGKLGEEITEHPHISDETEQGATTEAVSPTTQRSTETTQHSEGLPSGEQQTEKPSGVEEGKPSEYGTEQPHVIDETEQVKTTEAVSQTTQTPIGTTQSSEELPSVEQQPQTPSDVEEHGTEKPHVIDETERGETTEEVSQTTETTHHAEELPSVEQLPEEPSHIDEGKPGEQITEQPHVSDETEQGETTEEVSQTTETTHHAEELPSVEQLPEEPSHVDEGKPGEQSTEQPHVSDETEQGKTTQATSHTTETPSETTHHIVELPSVEQLSEKPSYIGEGKLDETTKYAEEPTPVEGELPEQYPIEHDHLSPEHETETAEEAEFSTPAYVRKETEKPYETTPIATQSTEKTEQRVPDTQTSTSQYDTESESTTVPAIIDVETAQPSQPGNEIKYDVPTTEKAPLTESAETTVGNLIEKEESTKLPQQTSEGLPEKETETPEAVTEAGLPKETSTEGITGEQPKATEIPEHVPVPGEAEKLPEIPTTSERGEVATGYTEHPELETASEKEHGIPGEGNCLVDGQTYKNNSDVPPINHCQISCKCLSSILQCESVTCSPPPSNLQHCMPVYQGPDSCCPTYSCTVPGVTSMESDSHKLETTTLENAPATIGVNIIIPSEEGSLKPEGTTVPSRDATELPEFGLPEEPTQEHGTELPEQQTQASPEKPFEHETVTTASPGQVTEGKIITQPSTEQVPQKETEQPAYNLPESTTLEGPAATHPKEGEIPEHEAPSESTTQAEAEAPVEKDKGGFEPEVTEGTYEITTKPSATFEHVTESITSQPAETEKATTQKAGEVSETATEAEEILKATTASEIETATESATESRPETITDAVKEFTSPKSEEGVEITTYKPLRITSAPVIVEDGQKTTTQLPKESPEAETESVKEHVPEQVTEAELATPSKETVSDETSESGVSQTTFESPKEITTKPSAAPESEQVTTEVSGLKPEFDGHPHAEEEESEEESATKHETEEHVTEPHVSTEKSEPEEHVTEPHVSTEKSEPEEHVTEPHGSTEKSEPEEHITEPHGSTEKSEPEEHVTEPHAFTEKSEPEEHVTEPHVSTEKSELEEHVTEPHVSTEKSEPEEHVTEPHVSTEKSEPEEHVTEPHVSTEKSESEEHVTEPHVSTEKSEPQEVVPEHVPEQEGENEILGAITEESLTEKVPESISHVTETHVEGATSESLPKEPSEITTLRGESATSEELATTPSIVPDEAAHISSETPKVTTVQPGESSSTIKHEVEIPTESTITEKSIEAETGSEKTSITEEEVELATTEASGITEKYIPTDSTPQQPGQEEPLHPVYVPESTPSENLPTERTEEGTTIRYVQPDLEHVSETTLPPKDLSENDISTESLPESATEKQETTTSSTKTTSKPFVYIPPIYESPEEPEQETTEIESEYSRATTLGYEPESSSPAETLPEHLPETVQPEEGSGLETTEGEVPHVTETEQQGTEATIVAQPEAPKVTVTAGEQEESTEPFVTVTPIPAEQTTKQTEGPVEEGTQPSKEGQFETKPETDKETQPQEITQVPHEQEKEQASTEIPKPEEISPPKESLPEEEQAEITEGPIHKGTLPPKESLPEGQDEKTLVTEGVEIVTGQPEAPQYTTQQPIEESAATEISPQKPEIVTGQPETPQYTTQQPIEESPATEISPQKPENTSFTSSEKPIEGTVTTPSEGEIESRPTIPGEGQEASEEHKPEEVYTSPTVTSTPQYVSSTELFTSGQEEEITRKSILGELSTSAPSTTITSSTTIHPPHGLPEEPDYQTQVEEEEYDDDQSAFGPGTCRYGGKVYVSAQQIPRDDPCDFCFCFRSDIICLQQSCPPPIPRCHEEPIRGFCCPRYECPVSMATSVNITTTTTTTTTTLPPHFMSHAYKGRAHRSGCQIQGKAYNVGEEIKSASGPCLHCTCGGNGQMKCDPKACSPEPMLRQMIAAAESRRRR